MNNPEEEIKLIHHSVTIVKDRPKIGERCLIRLSEDWKLATWGLYELKFFRDDPAFPEINEVIETWKLEEHSNLNQAVYCSDPDSVEAWIRIADLDKLVNFMPMTLNLRKYPEIQQD